MASKKGGAGCEGSSCSVRQLQAMAKAVAVVFFPTLLVSGEEQRMGMRPIADKGF